MKQKILLGSFALIASLALSGCGNNAPQETNTTIIPPANKPLNQNQQQTQQQIQRQEQLKQQTPNSANSLPTVVDETEKDLQAVENDLKELDTLDMSENDAELN
jgi:predicted small lipoprotein YifL